MWHNKEQDASIIIPARKISDNVVEHLQHSLQQVEEGKTTVLKKSDIKNFLGLE